jgi:glutamate synthase domain-containing protein 1
MAFHAQNPPSGLHNGGINTDNSIGERILEMTTTIQDELDGYVRYSRFGLFNESSDVYGDILESYEHLFPVTAEHADSLLEQGAYYELFFFINKKLEDAASHGFLEDEIALLRLWKGLAGIHIYGDVESALNEARVWRQEAAGTSFTLGNLSPDKLSPVDVSRMPNRVS